MRSLLLKCFRIFSAALLVISLSCRKDDPKPADDVDQAYVPSKSDDATHHMKSLNSFEWWYFDASFDNGWSMVSVWQYGTQELTPLIGVPYYLSLFTIYDSTGKSTFVPVLYEERNVTISNTTCDVKMGDNHISGYYPEYTLHFMGNEIGADLTFTNITQGFRDPPAGIYPFAEEPYKFLGWVVAQPRASVSGKLYYKGREISVKGSGYHDHNWGNAPLSSLYSFWYWGRILLNDHTIVYSSGEQSEALGKKPMELLMAFSGKKLIENSSAIRREALNMQYDTASGIWYPEDLKLTFSGKNISGTADMHLERILEKYWNPLDILNPGHGYIRFLSTCQTDLVIDGKKVNETVPVIHELMIP